MPADNKSDSGEEFIREIVAETKQPVALVLTKIDLLPKERLLPLIERYRHLHDFLAILPVSAVTGAGVDELVQVVVAQLPEGPAYFPEDILTDLPERFLAGEMVREKLFQFTRDEVPYSTAVTVDRFFERTDGLIEIDATINVERDSQKGVVIGKGGAMLKKIGTAARKDLEDFLQTRIFLQLFVRVQKEWSENSHLLKEFGY
jgi:GTP-binding protein Era